MPRRILLPLALACLAACSSSDDDAGGAAKNNATGSPKHRVVQLGPGSAGGAGSAQGGSAGSGAQAGGSQAGGSQAGGSQADSATIVTADADEVGGEELGHEEGDVGGPSADPLEMGDGDYDLCNYDSDDCSGSSTPSEGSTPGPYLGQAGWDDEDLPELSDGEDGEDIASDPEQDDPPTIEDTGEDLTDPPPEMPAPTPGSKPFWRIVKPGDPVLAAHSLGKSKRWWLVSNADNPAFLTGVNTVMANENQATCEGMDTYVYRGTSKAALDPAKLAANMSAEWTRLTSWGFNSVAAWSSSIPGAPYSVVLNGVTPTSDDYSLRNSKGTVLHGGTTGDKRVGDPYHPGYIAQLVAMAAKDVAPRKDDPNLQMYFAGNELGIFDLARKAGGVRDFRRWIWTSCPAGATPSDPTPQCAQHALVQYLRAKYKNSIDKLNSNWKTGTKYASFEQIIDPAHRPVPFTSTCESPGKCPVDLQGFVHHRLLKQWAAVVTGVVRAADPNHLVSSPRLAVANARKYRFWRPGEKKGAEVWTDDLPKHRYVLDGMDTLKINPLSNLSAFDVISINIYDGSPRFNKSWLNAGLNRLRKLSGRPVNISEFSVRARIPGWSNRGGAPSFVHQEGISADQKLRGKRYKSQARQFLSYPFVIGMSWHAWSDRFHSSSKEKQINMGLVQCTAPKLKDKKVKIEGLATEAGHRWDAMTDVIAPFNRGLMKGLVKRANK